MPLEDLLIRIIVTTITGESIGIYDTAERIAALSQKSISDRQSAPTNKGTHQISSMRIELSSRIVFLKVNQSLVDVTNDLEVIGGLHKLDASECIGGNDASTTASLCAPSDFLAFRISDYGVGFRRRPQAEV